MRSKLQLRSVVSSLLCAALVLGCRRERAVDFALIEERNLVRLTVGDCPTVVIETSAPSAGRARFDPASGLTVATSSLELRDIEPALPPRAPPGFTFVATVDRAAPRDCHDAGYEVPAAFFRARPVSVAQLQAGRFELRSTGTARVGAARQGQLAWEWSVRFESASPTDVAPPRLETWDHCLAGVGEAVNRREIVSARMGVVSLGDGGCDWLTAVSDGGTRVASRHKVFGTLLSFDATRGTTTAAPDVRVISEQAVSMSEFFEWYDDDGDGRHDLERRATFGPEGDEQSVEQIVWNDAGAPQERALSTKISGREQHVVNQLFVDGGWRTTSEYDSAPGCSYQPIVPIRVPGK